jgi:hypothetical protein
VRIIEIVVAASAEDADLARASDTPALQRVPRKYGDWASECEPLSVDDLSDDLLAALPLAASEDPILLGVSEPREIVVLETALDETDLDELTDESLIQIDSLFRKFVPGGRPSSIHQPSVLEGLMEEEEEELSGSSRWGEDTAVQAEPPGRRHETSEEEVLIIDAATGARVTVHS